MFIKILGGNTVIGKNSIIGGSVFITKSIEPDSQVFNTYQLRISNINNSLFDENKSVVLKKHY